MREIFQNRSPGEQEEVGLLLDRLSKLSVIVAVSGDKYCDTSMRTQCSFTMSSTFCTVVFLSLPVKSNKTPSEVTLRPLCGDVQHEVRGY